MEGNYWSDVRQEHTKKVERQMYKMVIKPAMVHRAECWEVRKGAERKLHTTEISNVHVAVDKRKDKTRSCEKCRHLERGTHIYPMAEFLRRKRLRWFGHVQRQDKEEAMRKIQSRPGTTRPVIRRISSNAVDCA